MGRCCYGKLFFEFLPRCSYHGRVLIDRKPAIFMCFGLCLAIRRALLMGCHEPSVTGAGTYYPGAARIYLGCWPNKHFIFSRGWLYGSQGWVSWQLLPRSQSLAEHWPPNRYADSRTPPEHRFVARSKLPEYYSLRRIYYPISTFKESQYSTAFCSRVLDYPFSALPRTPHSRLSARLPHRLFPKIGVVHLGGSVTTGIIIR